MALPSKQLLVLPNPWAFVHPERGPQGVCHVDTGGRGSPVRFVGARLDRKLTRVTEARDLGDPRTSRQFTLFEYPSLDEALLKPSKHDPKTGQGGAVSVAKSPYYFDRLADGDLVPADPATADACNCKYDSLEEARDAAKAEFELHYGTGSFDECLKESAKLVGEERKAVEAAAKAAAEKDKAEKALKGRAAKDKPSLKKATAPGGAGGDK